MPKQFCWYLPIPIGLRFQRRLEYSRNVAALASGGRALKIVATTAGNNSFSQTTFLKQVSPRKPVLVAGCKLSRGCDVGGDKARKDRVE